MAGSCMDVFKLSEDGATLTIETKYQRQTTGAEVGYTTVSKRKA